MNLKFLSADIIIQLKVSNLFISLFVFEQNSKMRFMNLQIVIFDLVN